MLEQIYAFLFGVLATLSLVCGLFFIRYWRSSGDRFFAFFAIAFWALGANWALMVGRHPDDEYTPYFYLLRLVAFLLILSAIVDKNRRTSRSE
ncbi:MAG TPA: DUF5985 family protein [Kofleriaceae bacterium]